MTRILILVAAFATAPARADVLWDWTSLALTCGASAKQLPFVQSRTMAMTHVAMFEAINGPDGPYRSYLEAVPSAPKITLAAVGVVNDESRKSASAAVAAHEVLEAIFPDQREAIDAALEKSLIGTEPAAREAAQADGRAIARAVLALRANDGASAPNTYRPVTKAGKYVPTALPVGPSWGAVKPWVMANGAQFRPPPPPSLKSKQWAEDYTEIAAVGAKASATRTPQQTEAARFWTVVGPVSYLHIVHELASRPGRSQARNARLYALVSMAAADSYIAVLDAKYHYSFWRPITAIRNADIDDNPATTRDAAWEPLVDTPMHPEYPCAHCINSGAVQVVLENDFGRGKIGNFSMTSPTAPGVTHTWDDLADFQAEVSNARIWGGIHYRNSAVVGTDMGRRIGKLAVASALQPK
jgi:PAP2 superfamily